MNIHPLAAVNADAKLGADVEIGPFCVIERDVQIGDGCRLEGGVTVKSGTTLGPHNRVCEGTVLGGLAQHTHPPERSGRLVIGSHNTIRENSTIHRALSEGAATVVGDHNFLMVNAHVAHDCRVGDNVILVNNVMLGGHVTVEDRAYLGGGAAVHQFCRVGRMAMLGGQAHVIKEVPPYVTIDGQSGLVVGLNSIGLRRNGFRDRELAQLKAAYRILYRSGLSWRGILERLQAEFPTGAAAEFWRFCAACKRGIVQERRLPPAASVRLHEDVESVSERQTKAG